ncbi:MAG: cache domain-containing protein [Proteobacteria bacterium]|nr:cache domain-containing protein [Pseudomonadota bacterium]MBU1715098.1 cache domain-containing protein [Pseudomonadota bacterium]
MLSSPLSRKIFFPIFFLVLLYFVAVYFIAIPLIKNTVYRIEDEAALTILNNVHTLVTSRHQEIEAYRQAALAAHKQQLKNITQIQESYLKEKLRLVQAGLVDEKTAKNAALEELRTFKYGNNDYLWVADYNSVLISHPDPQLHKADFSGVKDIYGNLIVPPMVKIAREQGEGYTSYWWRRLGSEQPVEKLTYSKDFPEWHWVIGTGLYVDDVEEEMARRKKVMIEELREILTNIKIASTGYMYIFDAHLNMLIHPNSNIEGTNFSTLTDPVSGRKIGDELMAAAHRQDNTFTYKWDKPDDKGNYIYDKISWVSYFKDFDWYIASSVYTDELNASADTLRNRIMIASLLIFALLIMLALLFVNKLLAPVHRLSRMANQVRDGDLSVQCAVESNDELGLLAGTMNEMVQQLRDNIAGLDAKVLERTRELDHKNEVLKKEIEDRLQAERDLQAAKVEADRANRAKGDFLANMSHEIRTPMNAIIGMADLVKTTTLDMKQREYIEILSSSSRSLLRIINDILDFSKIEADRLEMENIFFRIAEVTEEIADIFRDSVIKKQIELVIDITPEVPYGLIGDPARLRQILVNLIANAFKFTSTGEICLLITVESTIDQTINLRFRVSDTGKGINPEKIPHLFESFSQEDTSISRKYGGTGLGLAICRKLVRLMGGAEIQVESEPERGSVFTFTLPFGQSSLRDPLREIVPAEIENLRVLIVEDNRPSRKMMTRMLESFGIHCDSVADGEAALALYAAPDLLPHDLLFMDFRLPGRNGLAIAEEILRRSANKKPAIILISAFADETVRAKAEAIGIRSFLAKPIKQSNLFDTIIDFLGCPSKSGDREELFRIDPSFAGARILLTEDNQTNQFVALEILTKAGLQVDIAENGRQAVQALTDRNYDAVLMDIQMPEMDGIEATHRIRALAGREKLPIIAMTANAMKGDRERCLAAGMNDYISKPINRPELFRVLAALLPKGKSGTIPVREIIKPTNEKAPSLPGINTTAGMKRLGGSWKVFRQILLRFNDESQILLEKISQAAAEADHDTLRRHAHSLAGAGGNVGAERLCLLCRELEQNATAPENEARIEAISHELAVIRPALNKLKTQAETAGLLPIHNPTLTPEDFKARLDRLTTHLVTGDLDEITKIMATFSDQVLPAELTEDFEKLRRQIADYDFKAAAELIAKITKS